jgi:HSP20 family protein
MKLIKRKNFSPAFPTFFDDFFTRDLLDWDRDLAPFKTNPAVNIIEHDEHYAIEVAVPGLAREDFNVELDDNLLTISFEKKEEKEETGKYTRREFRYASFKRSFTLPEGSVDTDKIDANYESGILKLVLPKREEAKARAKRTINIG